MTKHTLHTTIIDPSLEPFSIVQDDYCVTVNERIQPNSTHFLSKGKGTEYFKPQGYFSTVERALEKIAELKLHNKKDYATLAEFLEEFKSIKTEIKQFVNESIK